MEQTEKKEQAIRLLNEKAKALGRLPHRGDFAELEVVFIKACLGPWPRALEAAGLKEPKTAFTAAQRKKRKNYRKRRESGDPSKENKPL